MCDWSQGRILAVTLERSEATYTAKSEIFLEGQPLNCSDIDVGPDGWLYFCVGGRNTAGSIFRIVRADQAGKPAAGCGGGRGSAAPSISRNSEAPGPAGRFVT